MRLGRPVGFLFPALGCNGGNGEKRKWKPKRFSLCGNGNGKGGVVETEGLFLGLIGFPAFDASPDNTAPHTHHMKAAGDDKRCGLPSLGQEIS